MLSFLKKLCKYTLIFASTLLVILAIFLASLDGRQFEISNQELQKFFGIYNSNLRVESSSSKIVIKNLGLNLKIDNLVFYKDSVEKIVLNKVQLKIQPFHLKTTLSAQVIDVPLGHFVKFHETEKLSIFIDNFVKHNHIIFSGDILLDFRSFKLEQALIKITSQEGWHDPMTKDLPQLKLKELYLSLKYEDDQVVIEKFLLSYVDNFQLALTGSFAFDNDNLLLAAFQTDLKSFPVDYLQGLWHPRIAHEVQAWVTKNITKGVVKQLTGNFNITGDDLKASVFRKDAVNINMNVVDIDVKYLPDYIPITQVSGNILIDGAGVHLINATGLYQDSKLENIQLDIPFNNCELSLKADATGNIASFKQFIPDAVNDGLKKFDIDYAAIKGTTKSSLNLVVPILESFSLKNFSLDVNSSLTDVTLDLNKVISFASGNLSVSNNEDGIRFSLQGDKIVAIRYESLHELEHPEQFDSSFHFELNTPKPIKFFNKLSVNGLFKGEFALNNKLWRIDLNLDQAEVSLKPITYTKGKNNSFSFICNGEFTPEMITAQKCELMGKDLSGQARFLFSSQEHQLKEFHLDNIKLGKNDFRVSIENKNSTIFYDFIAKYLDLTDFKFADLVPKKGGDSNFVINLAIDKIFVVNKSEPYNIKGRIVQQANSPIDIDIKVSDSNKQLTITKIRKNDKLGYLLHSTDTATFARDFNIYNNLKNGELWIEVYPKKNKNNTSYVGTVKLLKFAFSETSPLAKIIMGITSPLNSPEAFISSLRGGSVQADSLGANVNYNNGSILFNHGEIKGDSYEVKFNGYVDFNKSKMDFRGVYIPSVYGINKLVSSIPLIGTLLSGGKDSALIGANFSINGDLKNPDTSFNPLSVLAPGFLKNLF